MAAGVAGLVGAFLAQEHYRALLGLGSRMYGPSQNADEAFRELSKRAGVLELRIFAIAMTVQRQAGGNMSETLDRLAGLLERRIRMLRAGGIRHLDPAAPLPGVLSALQIVDIADASGNDGLSPPDSHPHLRVNETEGLLEAVKLGLGIGQLPDLLMTDELARGELVELLPEHRPEVMPIHLIYPSRRLLPSRVRAAIEVLSGLSKRRAAQPSVG